MTESDFDFKKKTLSITKSYQRLRGEDVITKPKTKQSIRVIPIPDKLCLEIKQYIALLYDYKPGDRLFVYAKSKLNSNLKRIADKAGVKQIRIHDLRHSHISYLIELGYSALAIAGRAGHEGIEITFRYAHLFPQVGEEMASRLNEEMELAPYGAESDGTKKEAVPDDRFQVLRFGKSGAGAADRAIGAPETRLPA